MHDEAPIAVSDGNDFGCSVSALLPVLITLDAGKVVIIFPVSGMIAAKLCSAFRILQRRRVGRQREVAQT